jgi:DNA-binding response OmpR family regulator
MLVVDDTLNIRVLLRAALERAGHEVDEAGTGREAIALAVAHEPDGVLLDAMMPEMTGLEALPELRRLLPTARIVMFSSLVIHADAIRAGADAYVQKGTSLDELLAVLLEAPG